MCTPSLALTQARHRESMAALNAERTSARRVACIIASIMAFTLTFSCKLLAAILRRSTPNKQHRLQGNNEGSSASSDRETYSSFRFSSALPIIRFNLEGFGTLRSKMIPLPLYVASDRTGSAIIFAAQCLHTSPYICRRVQGGGGGGGEKGGKNPRTGLGERRVEP